MRPLLCSALLLSGLLVGCAHGVIAGQVQDRNGQPVNGALVSVEPGGVVVLTDPQGRYRIDYLRDAEGEREPLHRHTDYTVSAFKPGYHVLTQEVHFQRGELLVEPVVLVEDTIRVDSSLEGADPYSWGDRSHSGGATYEGE